MLPAVYIFFLILLLTLPDKTPSPYFPNYYLPLVMQQEILPSVAEELIALDSPTRSGKPLEILQFPQNMSSVQLLQNVTTSINLTLKRKMINTSMQVCAGFS